MPMWTYGLPLWVTKGAEHRPATAQGARRQLTLHVYPYLGDRTVGGLKRGDIEHWIKDRRKVLADSTTAITYGRLKAVLTYAVHNDMIPKNPCDGIKAPSVRTKEIKPLPQEAVTALIAGAPAKYRAMILLAAGSGLRLGELVGLERQHLDMDKGEVHVRQQAVRLDAGDPYIGPPKTDSSYRTVPLAKAVVEALNEHLRRFPPVAVELVDKTDPRLPNANGRAINGGGWSVVWGNLRKRANAALERRTPRYGCRRRPACTTCATFCASMLIAHRESVKTVQKRLGHAKASVTLDVYVHLFEDIEDTTRDAVQGVLGDISMEY
jgi:integrase